MAALVAATLRGYAAGSLRTARQARGFSLSVGECVYGAGGVPDGGGVWQNVDGKRVDDGRYTSFVKAVKARGIPDRRIYTDPLRTYAYGTDASFYRLNPKAVVQVTNEDDVIAVLSEARRWHTPVTFRAAGTSLSGQAITDSVLVKISHQARHWRQYSIRDGGDVVVVEPGLIGGEVNAILKRYAVEHGLPARKIGPDPASLESCMIGGIVSNNSSGMCCGVAGNTYHTMVDLKCILVDGTRLDTSCPISVEKFQASHADLLASLARLAEEVQGDEDLAARINRKFSIKCTTGYSINALVDFPPSQPIEILKHLLVGSEGTLAFISEVTYRTLPDHPHRASAFMVFKTVAGACNAAQVMKESGIASAAELFDYASLKWSEDNVAFTTAIPDAVGCPRTTAGLLVEVSAPDAAGLEAKIDDAWAALEASPLEIQFFTDAARSAYAFQSDPKKFNVFWDMRKGLIPKVGGARPKGNAFLIEDVACPITSLASMTCALVDMFNRHGYPDACVFGHAMDGNLHLVLSQAFNEAEDLAQFDAMMKDMADIVAVKHKGSLKGEHGTGRNVASFVELEWGRQAYSYMQKIKTLFDPDNLLNPGVLLTADPDLHVKSLKVLPQAKPDAVGDIIDKCIECGFCESNCPSKDITLTPRQRITTYREMTRLRTKVDGAAATPQDQQRLQAFEASYKHYGIETCAADGMCQAKCPVSINTGSLVKTLRQDRQESNAVSRGAARLVADHFALFSTITRCVLKLTGAVRRVPGGDALLSATTTLLRQGWLFGPLVPVWTRYTPLAADWGASGRVQAAQAAGAALKVDGGSPKVVVYVPSCVHRMMRPSHPDVAGDRTVDAFMRIAERAGYTVVVPDGVESMCCGMLFESRGHHCVAQRKGGDLMAAVRALSSDFTLPVVCETSPCAKQLEELGAVVYDPLQFVALNKQRLTFKKVRDRIAVHVPCSSKKLGATDAFLTVAALCSGGVVDSGVPCCGSAGDRGLRFPELPRASIAYLRPEARGLPSFSASQTCELGLSNATDQPWGSLLCLVDEATASVP
eukprot:TRINITY_DN13287_c0_g1_i1.p1 TRINITY_DN13287_c0_g1~~TRINITY_DN13287_c0_g1_i1.p1  ORF type:complete len:1045 (+),score=313.96 TRINITY_DN13287_c0_g1_i1:42-3176(+)